MLTEHAPRNVNRNQMTNSIALEMNQDAALHDPRAWAMALEHQSTPTEKPDYIVPVLRTAREPECFQYSPSYDHAGVSWVFAGCWICLLVSEPYGYNEDEIRRWASVHDLIPYFGHAGLGTRGFWHFNSHRIEYWPLGTNPADIDFRAQPSPLTHAGRLIQTTCRPTPEWAMENERGFVVNDNGDIVPDTSQPS